jgi:phosphoribosyl-AMP cyclohydrolase
VQESLIMEPDLKFDPQGLLPVVTVDDKTGEVLMLAFMNRESLRLTLETGEVYYFSRSRNTLWHKGEQSGNVQEVKSIFVNCEQNSLLIRVIQRGGAACHEGYRSCYYRRLQPDGTFKVIAERIFDPATVYHENEAASTGLKGIRIAMDSSHTESRQKLETELRQLYGVYIYLRDNDLSEQSNTSRLLQEHSPSYLVSRLADELQELADVQSGEHFHTGRQSDTILEGSQVGYWLFLLASTRNVPFGDFLPHTAVFEGYNGNFEESKVIEVRQECLNQLASADPASITQGLHLGFTLIGWACASAGISPLAPAEFDLEQMRRKGLVK